MHIFFLISVEAQFHLFVAVCLGVGYIHPSFESKIWRIKVALQKVENGSVVEEINKLFQGDVKKISFPSLMGALKKLNEREERVLKISDCFSDYRKLMLLEQAIGDLSSNGEFSLDVLDLSGNEFCQMAITMGDLFFNSLQNIVEKAKVSYIILVDNGMTAEQSDVLACRFKGTNVTRVDGIPQTEKLMAVLEENNKAEVNIEEQVHGSPAAAMPRARAATTNSANDVQESQESLRQRIADLSEERERLEKNAQDIIDKIEKNEKKRKDIRSNVKRMFQLLLEISQNHRMKSLRPDQIDGLIAQFNGLDVSGLVEKERVGEIIEALEKNKLESTEASKPGNTPTMADAPSASAVNPIEELVKMFNGLGSQLQAQEEETRRLKALLLRHEAMLSGTSANYIDENSFSAIKEELTGQPMSNNYLSALFNELNKKFHEAVKVRSSKQELPYANVGQVGSALFTEAVKIIPFGSLLLKLAEMAGEKYLNGKHNKIANEVRKNVIIEDITELLHKISIVLTIHHEFLLSSLAILDDQGKAQEIAVRLAECDASKIISALTKPIDGLDWYSAPRIMLNGVGTCEQTNGYSDEERNKIFGGQPNGLTPEKTKELTGLLKGMSADEIDKWYEKIWTAMQAPISQLELSSAFLGGHPLHPLASAAKGPQAASLCPDTRVPDNVIAAAVASPAATLGGRAKR
jgi:hypothetical protein